MIENIAFFAYAIFLMLDGILYVTVKRVHDIKENWKLFVTFNRKLHSSVHNFRTACVYELELRRKPKRTKKI